MELSAGVKRGFLFIESSDYEKADKFFEKALDDNPEDSYAYIGKLLIEYNLNRIEDLSNCELPFQSSRNYELAYRFADDSLKQQLDDYAQEAETNKRNRAEAKLNAKYSIILKHKEAAKTAKDYESVIKDLKTFNADYKDVAALVSECEECIFNIQFNEALQLKEQSKTKSQIYRAVEQFKALGQDKEAVQEQIELCKTMCLDLDYEAAKKLEDALPAMPTSILYSKVSEAYKIVGGYKDAVEKVSQYSKLSEDMARQEAEILAAENAEKERLRKAKAQKAKIIVTIVCVMVVAVCAAYYWYTAIYQPQKIYNQATTLIENKDYKEAINTLEPLAEKDYKDSKELILLSNYNIATDYLNKKSYKEASSIFADLKDYKDSAEKYDVCETAISDNIAKEANALIKKEEYSKAVSKIDEITYSNYSDKKQNLRIHLIKSIFKSGNYSYLHNIISNNSAYKSIVKSDISSESINKYISYIKKANAPSYYSLSSFNSSAREQLDLLEEVGCSDSYYSNLKELYGYTTSISNADSYRAGFENELYNIISLWDFEPTQKIMQSDDCITHFLVGEWYARDGDGYTYDDDDYYYDDYYDDDYHIEFYYNDEDRVSVSYNIPYPDFDADYYQIKDMKFIYKRDNDNETKDVYKLTLVNANKMKVYSYKDGHTYTVYRD